MKHFRFRSALVLTWILLLNIEGFCQQNEDFDKNFIPPSPTPYELGKYGSHPVSFYRGTVGIEVPIYTLKHGDFSLPITLSYNSSGIKVEDIASWVGLGWSLNAGGTISIMTKGKSDFIYDRLWIRNEEQLLNKNIPQDDTLEFVRQNMLDSEPDIFNYNFCGYSGQFILDNNFNVRFTKNTNGLEFTADKASQTVIAKDLYGRTYLFNKVDVELSEKMIQQYGFYLLSNTYVVNGPWMSDPNEPNKIPTAFNLSEIILENDQGRIVFEYENEIVQYLTRLSGSISNKINNSFNPPHYCHSFYSNEWEDPTGTAFSSAHIINDAKRLKSIKLLVNNESEVIELVFHANTQRDDLKNTKRLDRIDLNVNLNKQFDWTFQYEYFQSNINKNELKTGNELGKRLKLKKIQQRDSYGVDIDNGYRFTYYGDPLSSLPSIRMPYRSSFDGYDHWGYNNNSNVSITDANNPSKLFPDITYQHFNDRNFICFDTLTNPPPPAPSFNCIGSFVGSNSDLFAAYPYSRGDRSPNETNMKAYTLEKIEYPTNGFSKFEFEANKVGYGYETVGGLRVARKSVNDGNTESLISEYFYSNGQIEERLSYLTGRFKNYYYSEDCRWSSNDFLSYSVDHVPRFPFGYIYKTSSYSQLHGTNTDYIQYLQVTELSKLNDQIMGKTIYTYNYNEDFPVLKFDFSFAYIDRDEEPQTKRAGIIFDQNLPAYPFKSGFSAPSYKRGLLTSVDVYNSNNIKISNTTNTYIFSNEAIIYGNEVHREHPNENRLYFISAYKLYSGKSFLETSTTTQYDLNGDSPVTSSTKNTYNPDLELLIKKIEYGNDIIETEYTYPIDFISSYQGSAPYKTMCDLSMINYPLETIHKRNGKVVGANLVKYAFFNSPSTIIKQKEMFVLHSDKGVTDFTPISWNFGLAEFNKDSRYSSEVLINKYDKIGRVLEYKKNDLIDNSVIWSSYLRMSPDAVVSNAMQEKTAYSGFEYISVTGGGIYGNWKLVQGPNWIVSSLSKIGSFALTTMSGSGNSPIETFQNIPSGKYKVSCWQKGGTVTFPSGAVVTEKQVDDWIFKEAVFQVSSSQKITIYINNAIIDELKLSPVEANMISFSYDLFDRMKGKSDDNGFGEKYVYDNAGRLIQIKDMNENILKTFEYNYAH